MYSVLCGFAIRFSKYKVFHAVSAVCIHSRKKMPKPGFYAVRAGRVPGIYNSWAECEAQVKGYPNASFKKFQDKSSAENYAGISFRQKSHPSNTNYGTREIQRTVSSETSTSNRISAENLFGNSLRQKTRPSVKNNRTREIQRTVSPEASTSFDRSSTSNFIGNTLRLKTRSSVKNNRTREIQRVVSPEASTSFDGSSTSNFVGNNLHQNTLPSITNGTSEIQSAVLSEASANDLSFEDEPLTAFDELLSQLDFDQIENPPPPQLDYEISNRPREAYYAVHRGAKPGVYRTWTECEAQIKTTRNASYRKFDNEEQALEYVRMGGIIKATKRELRDITYSNRVIKKRRTACNQEPRFELQNPDEPVVVFTDGASAQNGKKRARAGFGVYWGPNHPLNASKRLPGRQTNNRAEIQAAVYALHQAKQIGARKVKLYTDSQFLIHAITDWIKKWKINGWKLVNGESVVNKDDFLELEAVSLGLDVEWLYVRAHARNHGNDEADRLAVSGARLLLEPSNCSTFPKPEIQTEKVEPFILTSASSSSGDILPLIIPEERVERKTFYAVHKGKCPGIYKTWTECEEQIKDCGKPWFKKFSTEEEALEFVKSGKVTKKIQVPEYGPNEFVTVFTDGASSCNGQDDAKAGIGVYWGPGNELNTSMRLPGRQTNNRAEIFAAVHALNQAKQIGIKNVRLYTDSQFVIKGITIWIDNWLQNDWKSANGKPVVNKEDFLVLHEARKGLNVDWCYVKGHDNNPGNVEADKLAVAGCCKKLSEAIILT